VLTANHKQKWIIAFRRHGDTSPFAASLWRPRKPCSDGKSQVLTQYNCSNYVSQGTTRSDATGTTGPCYSQGEYDMTWHACLGSHSRTSDGIHWGFPCDYHPRPWAGLATACCCVPRQSCLVALPTAGAMTIAAFPSMRKKLSIEAQWHTCNRGCTK
jgi:hypothetical protein